MIRAGDDLLIELLKQLRDDNEKNKKKIKELEKETRELGHNVDDSYSIIGDKVRSIDRRVFKLEREKEKMLKKKEDKDLRNYQSF